MAHVSDDSPEYSVITAKRVISLLAEALQDAQKAGGRWTTRTLMMNPTPQTRRPRGQATHNGSEAPVAYSDATPKGPNAAHPAIPTSRYPPRQLPRRPGTTGIRFWELPRPYEEVAFRELFPKFDSRVRLRCRPVGLCRGEVGETVLGTPQFRLDGPGDFLTAPLRWGVASGTRADRMQRCGKRMHQALRRTHCQPYWSPGNSVAGWGI